MTIQIYITPTCPWCDKLKVWLKKKKLSYTEHDLIESDKARDDILEKSGQLAVPVIDIDGQIIVGFDEKKLEEAVKKGQ
ncbi:MAG TPA: glutaredoxin domain-containing protein [Candidatus Nanoarchaeia archaeon]|nr:glutaredoxin domain-containing protein [Candidatus Nanoarchaeia archaeon]